MNLDKKNAKYLQAYLIITGFDMGSLIADGDVGDQTKKAILAYQEEMRLPTDNGELNLPTSTRSTVSFATGRRTRSKCRPAANGVVIQNRTLPVASAVLEDSLQRKISKGLQTNIEIFDTMWLSVTAYPC